MNWHHCLLLDKSGGEIKMIFQVVAEVGLTNGFPFVQESSVRCAGGRDCVRYRVSFLTGPPPKISKYRKVNLG